MPIRIATNLSSINAQRHLGISNAGFSQSLERISSGLRINQSADDVAGLSVSQGMRGEIRGIVEGVRNAEAGTNLVQQAEGALNEINAISALPVTMYLLHLLLSSLISIGVRYFSLNPDIKSS